MVGENEMCGIFKKYMCRVPKTNEVRITTKRREMEE